MAKQKGILKVTGTLAELSFYIEKDGILVKTIGGISKNRIKNPDSRAIVSRGYFISKFS